MKERVLITGASGFVGYHLIDEALKNNMEVFAAVRKNSKVDHLKGFDIQYTSLKYNDIESLKKNLLENNYDYIIHAAGATRARSAKAFNHINATFVRNLAQAVVDSGVKLKKLVFISSLAAVGPLQNLKGIITENTPPHPISMYGKSKLHAEENLKKFSTLNYTILRPTGVYGPRDRDIFIFFRQIAKKGIEPYIGRKEQKLSFIYVTDLAKAAIKAQYAGNQKTYNLSDGNYYDRYQLADFIKDAVKMKTVKFHLPVNFVKFVATIAQIFSSLGRKPSVLTREKINELTAVNWCCDIGQAKADLGFYPEYNLKAGVWTSIEWYKLNKWL